MLCLACVRPRSLNGSVDVDVRELLSAAASGNLRTLRLAAQVDLADGNQQSPLHAGVQNAQLEVVEYLISTRKVCTSKRDQNGNTPLDCAVKQSNKRIIEFILSSATTDLTAQACFLTLQRAVECEDPALFAFVLQKSLARFPQIIQTTDNQKPLLHTIVEKNRPHHIHHLLENGANSQERYGGKLAIFSALKYADTACAFALLQHSAQLLDCVDDETGSPLLHCCVAANNINLVMLVAGMQRCDVNKRDERGRTSLYFACERGLDEQVRALLANNCLDIVSNENGDTPLHVACTGNSYKCVETLLGRVGFAYMPNNVQSSPAAICVKMGHVQCLVCLLDCPKVLELERQQQQRTLLHEAAELGQSNCLAALLHALFPTESRDEHGLTPLHIACGTGHTVAANLLLQAGANVECIDSNGQTPIHRAAAQGQLSVISLLLSSGAKRDSLDSCGMTAIQLAIKHHHMQVMKMLMEKGRLCTGHLYRDMNTLVAVMRNETDENAAEMRVHFMEAIDECPRLLHIVNTECCTLLNLALTLDDPFYQKALQQRNASTSAQLREEATLIIQAMWRGHHTRTLNRELCDTLAQARTARSPKNKYLSTTDSDQPNIISADESDGNAIDPLQKFLQFTMDDSNSGVNVNLDDDADAEEDYFRMMASQNVAGSQSLISYDGATTDISEEHIYTSPANDNQTISSTISIDNHQPIVQTLVNKNSIELHDDINITIPTIEEKDDCQPPLLTTQTLLAVSKDLLYDNTTDAVNSIELIHSQLDEYKGEKSIIKSQSVLVMPNFSEETSNSITKDNQQIAVSLSPVVMILTECNVETQLVTNVEEEPEHASDDSLRVIISETVLEKTDPDSGCAIQSALQDVDLPQTYQTALKEIVEETIGDRSIADLISVMSKTVQSEIPSQYFSSTQVYTKPIETADDAVLVCQVPSNFEKIQVEEKEKMPTCEPSNETSNVVLNTCSDFDELLKQYEQEEPVPLSLHSNSDVLQETCNHTDESFNSSLSHLNANISVTTKELSTSISLFIQNEIIGQLASFLNLVDKSEELPPFLLNVEAPVIDEGLSMPKYADESVNIVNKIALNPDLANDLSKLSLSQLNFEVLEITEKPPTPLSVHMSREIISQPITASDLVNEPSQYLLSQPDIETSITMNELPQLLTLCEPIEVTVLPMHPLSYPNIEDQTIKKELFASLNIPALIENVETVGTQLDLANKSSKLLIPCFNANTSNLEAESPMPQSAHKSIEIADQAIKQDFVDESSKLLLYHINIEDVIAEKEPSVLLSAFTPSKTMGQTSIPPKHAKTTSSANVKEFKAKVKDGVHAPKLKGKSSLQESKTNAPKNQKQTVKNEILYDMKQVNNDDDDLFRIDNEFKVDISENELFALKMEFGLQSEHQLTSNEELAQNPQKPIVTVKAGRIRGNSVTKKHITPKKSKKATITTREARIDDEDAELLEMERKLSALDNEKANIHTSLQADFNDELQERVQTDEPPGTMQLYDDISQQLFRDMSSELLQRLEKEDRLLDEALVNDRDAWELLMTE